MDDEVLVKLVRSGDLEAASSLLARHQDAVYTAALRLIGNVPEAEDIAQEALVRSFTHIGELASDASFAVWVKRIAVNLSLNFLRRRGILRFESLDDPRNAGRPSAHDLRDVFHRAPEEQLLAAELQSRVESAVEQLPPEQRVAVVLSDMYDYGLSEIAQLQRCGLSAAKMRVFRGRAALRKILESDIKVMELD